MESKEINICNICGAKYSGSDKCPECLMRYNAELEAEERVIFEDDEKVKLRDGKEYSIQPSSLKNARRLMKLLRTVNIDTIMSNFLPTDDEKDDENRQEDLLEVLKIAFVNYPDLEDEYLEDNIDLRTASDIIYILIGLNGLKK